MLIKTDVLPVLQNWHKEKWKIVAMISISILNLRDVENQIAWTKRGDLWVGGRGVWTSYFLITFTPSFHPCLTTPTSCGNGCKFFPLFFPVPPSLGILLPTLFFPTCVDSLPPFPLGSYPLSLLPHSLPHAQASVCYSKVFSCVHACRKILSKRNNVESEIFSFFPLVWKLTFLQQADCPTANDLLVNMSWWQYAGILSTHLNNSFFMGFSSACQQRKYSFISTVLHYRLNDLRNWYWVKIIYTAIRSIFTFEAYFLATL